MNKIRHVVCAACRFGNIIICGARHFDIVMQSQLYAMQGVYMPVFSSMWNQGFIDQYGVFMDRKEAMQVAKKAGQEIDIELGCRGDSKTLYSEGLY
jgi:hypothetical protein